MARKIQIRLLDNPSNNNGYVIIVSSPNNFYSSTNATTFKTVPTNANHVAIGVNVLASLVNLYNKVVADYVGRSYISISYAVDTLEIVVDDILGTSSTIGSITGDITVTHSDVTVAVFTRDNIILSRSPYNNIFQPSALFDGATINLKVYRGTRTDDAPATDTFTLSKQVIQAGQDKIRFEISKLLNDYTKNSIPTFGAIGVHTSSSYDSVWVDAEINALYLGDSIGSATKQFLAIDGFGWHTELYNPMLTKNALTTLNNHIFYLGSDYPLYFVSKGLIGITVDGNAVSFTLDEDINNQIIAYLNVGSYASVEGEIEVVLDYDTYQETYNFTVKDACRYPLYNCFFKNKYGFWQSIPFNLRSKKTLNIDSSSYQPVTSVYGEYSLASHNKKTYQPNLTEVISCNTDFIPEEYNQIFKELMASEFVYLENGGTYLPVNVKKNSLEYKTKIFEKLVQYTMDFEYSYNEINSVI